MGIFATLPFKALYGNDVSHDWLTNVYHVMNFILALIRIKLAFRKVLWLPWNYSDDFQPGFAA